MEGGLYGGDNDTTEVPTQLRESVKLNRALGQEEDGSDFFS
jgi:hypothetical protein